MKLAEAQRILGEHYPNLKDRYKISALSIFGSVARDEARPDSDIDILVQFAETPGLLEFIELQQRLELLLGCKVDLATPRSIKDYVTPEFLNNTIPIV